MKIIFLDFDGVIRIPVFTGEDKPEAEFCPIRKQRVANLAEKQGAKIVISSNWRKRKSREEVLRILGTAIPEASIHANWCTPTLHFQNDDSDETIPRGLEIIMWLYSAPEKVESFVILDDYASSRFPFISENHVRCTLLDGFTAEKYQEAAQILG